MSFTPASDSNLPRVTAALIGVGAIIALTVIMGFVNQENKPEPRVPVNIQILQKDVRHAVRQALHAYRVSGQVDPGIVRGGDNRMAPGMSAWYPSEQTVRISRPGGCEAWVRKDLVSYNRACRA